MSTTTPTPTPILPSSWTNRIAAIAAFLTGLAAAVAGIINVLPTAWQSTTLAVVGVIGAVATCLHYMLGSQKYDAQVAQVLIAKHNADAAVARASTPATISKGMGSDLVKYENSTEVSPIPFEVESSLSPADKARIFMGTIMSYMHTHSSQMGYMEVRSPDDIMSSHGISWTAFMAFIARGGTIIMDCSESITTICRWAGLKDPNGPNYNYNGYGNTQTMMDYLPHIALRDVHEGSIIVFGGPMSEQHAIMVVAANPNDPENPTVFSHGAPGVYIGPYSEIGPYFVNRGQPVVPLAIENILPKTPEPTYHYDWFDVTVRKLATDNNSERNVVRNYDIYRKHPVLYAKQLEVVHENLKILLDDLTRAMKESPNDNAKYHRDWRYSQLKDRLDGKLVEPTI
jgi:hypothetical protein